MIISSSKVTKTSVVLALVVLVFLALRLPGVHYPYHQDENKNVSAASTVEGAGNFFAHPPFMQMSFVADYTLFGADNFRVLPLIFSMGSVILLYYVVKRRAGINAAVWAVSLFTICFYNVLGSLQADVDGSILPFLFLLAVLAYDKYVESAGLASLAKSSEKWLAILTFALLTGMLIKLSFIVAVGAFALDYLWIHRKDRLFTQIGIVAAAGSGFLIIYVALLYLIQAIYPAFSISFMLGHANQFAGDEGRNWTQIIVQAVKALYYLSPLVLVFRLWLPISSIKKIRIFGLYLLLGCIFYFVLFDFSRGALDKYLMFVILPFVVMTGTVLSETFARMDSKKKLIWPIVAGIVISVGLFALNFLPQEVVALYPKTAWFSRVLHGHWNVLTPLNGGSGPLGFYVSFAFIAGSFIVSIVAALLGTFRKSWRVPLTVVIIAVGITYNFVFAEEFLYGRINGSAPQILAETTAFIAASPNIQQVMTFNDIGAFELGAMGKYAGRIYATPDAEELYRKKFTDFAGKYLVINIPPLYEGGLYANFFAQCKVLFETHSGKISGKVYDCPHDPATMSKL